MAAIVKEYKQLHDINTFGVLFPEDLTPKQKQDTLRAITLIQDKLSVNIKGIACLDSRAQI